MSTTASGITPSAAAEATTERLVQAGCRRKIGRACQNQGA